MTTNYTLSHIDDNGAIIKTLNVDSLESGKAGATRLLLNAPRTHTATLVNPATGWTMTYTMVGSNGRTVRAI